MWFSIESDTSLKHKSKHLQHQRKLPIHIMVFRCERIFLYFLIWLFLGPKNTFNNIIKVEFMIHNLCCVLRFQELKKLTLTEKAQNLIIISKVKDVSLDYIFLI